MVNNNIPIRTRCGRIMNIQKFVFNADEDINWPGTNCYLVTCKNTHKAIIIDPGCNEEELKQLIEEIEENNLQVKCIFNTHGHIDHFSGNKLLKEVTQSDILIHEDDNFLLNYENWLKMEENFQESPCMRCGEPGQLVFDVDHEREYIIGLCKNCGPLYEYSGSPPGDWLLQDGDIITIGDLVFDVIHTPGHTQGGICLYNPQENVIFTGDTLLEGFYAGSVTPSTEEELIRSVLDLLQLPEETRVLPGHGNETTIGKERVTHNNLLLN